MKLFRLPNLSLYGTSAQSPDFSLVQDPTSAAELLQVDELQIGPEPVDQIVPTLNIHHQTIPKFFYLPRRDWSDECKIFALQDNSPRSMLKALIWRLTLNIILLGSNRIDERSQIFARLSYVQEVSSWSRIYTVLFKLINSNCWKNVLKNVKSYGAVLMDSSGITLNEYDHRKLVCAAKLDFRKQDKYEK